MGQNDFAPFRPTTAGCSDRVVRRPWGSAKVPLMRAWKARVQGGRWKGHVQSHREMEQEGSGSACI